MSGISKFKRALGAYYAAQKEETENIYNYVIETLVDADFAQDYETAENMFEHMSSEFVAVILEEYIEEAKRSRTERRAANAGKKGYDSQGKPLPKQSNTHVTHDGDDNVAGHRHPNAAKIDLYKKNPDSSYTHVKSMTPSEFAHTTLPPKHKYGFDEFRSSKKFKDTTSPNRNITRIGDSRKRTAKKSVITARGGSAFGSNKPSTPMDDPGAFAKDLKTRIGVRGIERTNIHFTGGMRKGSVPENKGIVRKKITKPGTKKEISTDDHLLNVRHMAAASHDPNKPVTGPKIRAYQSRPATKAKGKVKPGDIVPVRVGKEKDLNSKNIGIRANTNPPQTIKQTKRARQRARRGMGEEMTSYEYWKQFI